MGARDELYGDDPGPLLPPPPPPPPEACPSVQILDALVPQMENQLVEGFRHLNLHIPEQVVEVPKISSSSRRCRPRVPLVQLMAEQLVEVPTIVSFSSLQQQTAEQIIDISVPGRGGGGGCVGLQDFSSGQNSTARLVERNVDIPVPGGGLHVLPDLVVQAHPQLRVMSVEKGFFGLFPS